MTWERLAGTTACLNASGVAVAGEEECSLEVCSFYYVLSKEKLAA